MFVAFRPLHAFLALALLAPCLAEPEAPASAPPARIAGLGRYLLFDVVFHEQLNKQRRALMFYLAMAMRLNRILVLPRPRLLTRTSAHSFSPEAQYVRWSELFNLSHINLLHPAVELDTFLSEHGQIELFVQVDSKARSARESGNASASSRPSQVSAAALSLKAR